MTMMIVAPIGVPLLIFISTKTKERERKKQNGISFESPPRPMGLLIHLTLLLITMIMLIERDTERIITIIMDGSEPYAMMSAFREDTA